MSDPQNFTPSNGIDLENTYALNQDNVIEGHVPAFDDSDGGGLSEFHTPDAEWEAAAGSKKIKVLSAIAVALVFGAAGVYAFTSYNASRPVVADNNLPQTTPPKMAAGTPLPPPAAPDIAQPSDSNIVAPAAPNAAPPAPQSHQQATADTPVRTKVARTAKPAIPDLKQQTQTEQQIAPQPPAVTPPENQAAAAPPIADPVSPTPPASSVAANPQPQPEITPVTPPAAQEAPSPAPQPAGPAPAQADGQATPAPAPVQ